MSESRKVHISQIQLIDAICAELDRQNPGVIIDQMALTAIIQSADNIVAAAQMGHIMVLEPCMTEDEKLARVRIVDSAIRAHYLSLPNKTEIGWAEVLLDPRKYNMTWRHMLKYACGQNDLDVNHFPPPIYLQMLFPGGDSIPATQQAIEEQ